MPVKMDDEAGGAVFFNAGADARQAGRDRTTNPYDAKSSAALWWSHGWDYLDRTWGVNAKGPVPALPPAKRGKGGRIRKFSD